MTENNAENVVETADGPTIRDHLQKYISNYPLFIIALILSLGTAALYIRYTIPKYKVNAQMLVKTDRSGASNSGDLIETALKGANMNLENELQLLKSVELMERVVSKSAFNIVYYKVGNVLDLDVYLDVPFRLVPHEIKDSNNAFNILVKDLTREGGMIAPASADAKFRKFQWSSPFTIGNQTFRLVQTTRLPGQSITYRAVWNPIDAFADDLQRRLYVGMLDNKTSIIELSMLVENLYKGQDLLNSICTEYIQASMEEKAKLADVTVKFIDDRLGVVAADLGGVEGNLANYQSANRVSSLEDQSSATFSNTNAVDKDLLDINNQKGVVDMISRYLNNPTYRNKLVPSTLGLSDGTLSSMISHYNELQIRKEKEAPYLQEENEIMKDLNNQISSVRASILESLQNIGENLRLKESGLRQQNNKYQQTLSVLPYKEKALQDIKRKQSITEGLYLYLLQKREEFAISSAAVNKPGYKQMDKAKGYGPVEPNNKKIWIMGVLAGLLIPIVIIGVRGMLNDKILTKNDLASRTSIPILGETNHVSKKLIKGVSLLNRDVIGEQFRIIRTRLSLLQRNVDKKVLLITSSQSNEGKSFVALHLAGVLAIPGKKVALINFDMRKAAETQSTKNLTDFVLGHTTDLKALHEPSGEIPSLHAYTARITTGNPSDLLLHEGMPALLQRLRREYEYIIIDSAPIGLVSDGYILSKYADTIIFVVRQGFTPKKKMELLKDVAKLRDMPEILLILNDVRSPGKQSYYGYGADYGFSGNGTSSLKKSFWKKSAVS
ncbi:hypothetical protein EXU57_20850 [Segetibacter sp. 3557_3]|uniref:GumC family protein n=1 Tax=Segetibacter sp. 3557_3 TaxID=2547429 RepID=UPI0010586A59|nr:division plane positioning ATPase MipZ [Segetibacter sp. 3557_3]TDH20845.1 hypothetical protein EXU57_20850 [Segetibacter sp. 3557_3]